MIYRVCPRGVQVAHGIVGDPREVDDRINPSEIPRRDVADVAFSVKVSPTPAPRKSSLRTDSCRGPHVVTRCPEHRSHHATDIAVVTGYEHFHQRTPSPPRDSSPPDASVPEVAPTPFKPRPMALASLAVGSSWEPDTPRNQRVVLLSPSSSATRARHSSKESALSTSARGDSSNTRSGTAPNRGSMEGSISDTSFSTTVLTDTSTPVPTSIVSPSIPSAAAAATNASLTSSTYTQSTSLPPLDNSGVSPR